MERTNVQLKCCWCEGLGDTTEMVLVEGVFPVHHKCRHDFVVDNIKAGNLPIAKERPSGKYGIARIDEYYITGGGI
jgi:hypothetical protein